MATIIFTWLRTSRMAYWTLRLKMTSNPSSPSSTYMPGETSIPITGVWRLLQQSKRNLTSISSNPNTYNHINNPDNIQVYTPWHIKWYHEYLPESQFPHPRFILLYYNTPYVTHLDIHPVPCQYHIHINDSGNKLPHPTNECRTYVWTPTYDWVRQPPKPQWLPQ